MVNRCGELNLHVGMRQTEFTHPEITPVVAVGVRLLAYIYCTGVSRELPTPVDEYLIELLGRRVPARRKAVRERFSPTYYASLGDRLMGWGPADESSVILEMQRLLDYSEVRLLGVDRINASLEDVGQVVINESL